VRQAANFANALPKIEPALGVNWASCCMACTQSSVGVVVGLVYAWGVGLAIIVRAGATA